MPPLRPSRPSPGVAARADGPHRPRVSAVRPAAALLLVLLALPLVRLDAQSQELVVHAYTLKHQKASEALMLIHPLLSPRGTVELQKGGNTLVVRDTVAALAQVIPVLRNFDHPARPLRLDVYVVRASRRSVSGQPTASQLPAELERRLRDLLHYEVYELEAQARLTTLEGQSVTYEMGSGFQASFRLGTVMADRRIRLSDFRMVRRVAGKPEQPLVHTNLNLWLEQWMSLGLAKSEASPEALMVVLRLRPEPPPPPRGQRAQE